MVICRSGNVGEGRYSRPIRVMGVAARLGKRMDRIAVDDEWKGFPYAFLSANGGIRHGFSGSGDRRTAGPGQSDGRGRTMDQRERWDGRN